MAGIAEDVSQSHLYKEIEMRTTNEETYSNLTTTIQDIHPGSKAVEKRAGPSCESLSKMQLSFIIIGVTSVVAVLSSVITAVIITQVRGITYYIFDSVNLLPV